MAPPRKPRAPKAPKTSRTWMLTSKGGSPRWFEVTLPLDEAPDFDPPRESDAFRYSDHAPLEVHLDGKLAATGSTWPEALSNAAKKLRLPPVST